MEVLETKYKNLRGDLYEIYVSPPKQTELFNENLNYTVFFRINKRSEEKEYFFTVKISDLNFVTWGKSSGKSAYNILKILGLLKVKKNLELNDFSENEYIFTSKNTQNTFDQTKSQLEKEIEMVKKRQPLFKEKKEVDKRDLRIKVLQLHYDKSEASQYTPIFRLEIAKELNLDYNGNILIDIIKFLEDKKLLDFYSNIEDVITTNGIEEVEKGFPNLKNNKEKSETEKHEAPININNSQLHFGSGDNKHGDEKEPFLSKFFWKLIIPIFAIVIATLILYFKFGIE
jgi:sugar-specific transcriptional regulator TrmB